MSAFAAVARKEARQIAPEALVLAFMAGAVPAILAVASSDVRESGAGLIFAVIFVAGAALLLGAGVFAGDPAPAFLAGRAIGAQSSLAARLTARGAALLLVASCALAATLLLDLDGPSGVRGTFLRPFVAVPTLLLAFLASAVGSAFRKRALVATLDGAVVTAIFFGLASWLSSWRGFAWFVIWAAVALHALFLPGLAHLLSDAAFDAKRFIARVNFAFLGVAVLLLAGWPTLGRLAAERKLDAAIARFEHDVLAGAPLLELPLVEASDDAKQLDVVARRLGCALAPLEADEDWRGRETLSGIVRQGLSATTNELKEPRIADALETHLIAHEADLSLLRSIVLRDGVTWPYRSTGEWMTWPDARGHQLVSAMLVADARRRRRQGDLPGALESLAAIQALSDALLRHPALPPRRYALVLLSRRIEVARELDLGAPSAPGADGLLRSLHEARAIDVRADANMARSGPPSARLIRAFLAPQRLRHAADRIESIREWALRERPVTPCEGVELPEPWSGLLPRDLGILLVQEDLTRVVERLIEWRRLHGVETPPAHLLASDACPGRSWLAEREASGTLIIKPWPEVTVLPFTSNLRHRLAAPTP